MGKRRADADNRRFFDEFEKVRVSRFRAMGVIDPAKRTALIPFPNGKTKLIGTGHTRLKYGGGYSYLRLPEMRQARSHALPDRGRAAMHSMLRCNEHQARKRIWLRQR